MNLYGYEVNGRMPLFTAENRQRVRLGLKTQTRRLITGKHINNGVDEWEAAIQLVDGSWSFWYPERPGLKEFALKAYPDGGGHTFKFGKVGDIRVMPEPLSLGFAAMATYADEGEMRNFVEPLVKWKWKRDTISSMLMPTSCGRTIVRYTDIHPEKLQSITEEDAVAEGVGYTGITRYTGETIDGFVRLWDSINGKKYPWKSNPWVWVVKWELIRSGL